MEGLNVFMKSAVEKNVLRGISLLNSGPVISHVMYADDVMLIVDWITYDMVNLTRILWCLASGLKVNFFKSKVFGFWVSDSDLASMASIIHCEAGYLPVNFLGLMVGENMGLSKNWNPVNDHVKKIFNWWKASTLSFGKKLTLVKAVLCSLTLYFFLSMFKAPIEVVDELEKIKRNYFVG
ncbi:uncharacterized protein LOC143529625 [Bidens hawaiensis]|uniref:uncharacterized protein LOC143529625 n=1 Tax=Bidens hawaiensis TaxID=980011 RepID=UPI00404AC8A3